MILLKPLSKTPKALPVFKVCNKCETEKPVAEFSKRSASSDGLQQHCKLCKLAYQRNNPKRNAVSAAYRNRNKALCSARACASVKKKPEY